MMKGVDDNHFSAECQFQTIPRKAEIVEKQRHNCAVLRASPQSIPFVQTFLRRAGVQAGRHTRDQQLAAHLR